MIFMSKFTTEQISELNDKINTGENKPNDIKETSEYKNLREKYDKLKGELENRMLYSG